MGRGAEPAFRFGDADDAIDMRRSGDAFQLPLAEVLVFEQAVRQPPRRAR